MADAPKTVLVVDDEEDQRTFVATVLEDNGFSTVTAANGKEALAKIDEKAPDLVALDMSMPEKSGVAVYRKLREDGKLKGIPVIIITGISEEFEKFISSRKQVPPPNGYIAKPVNPEELVRMVKGLL